MVEDRGQSGKKSILLGITGGIAAYKSAELVRLLVQEGIDVQVVMTESASRFIGEATLQALSGKKVFMDLWDSRIPNNMAHIELSRSANAILIAPASADFIAKLAHGLADDLLSTLCLARNCPLWVAPAMNLQMWNHPATMRNLQTLRQDGISVFGPDSGAQACGETGAGRMLEPAVLLEAILARFQPEHSHSLQGKRVLITAGPTFEAIDAVRGLTNRSSGKMGLAMAQAALDAGARVTLICGPICPPCPPVDKQLNVISAEEMFTAVKNEIADNDIFISVAAVADYRPAATYPHKLKKQAGALTLELVPNPDILRYVATLPKAPFCVGFAAETERIEQYAESKRRDKNLPLIVANDARSAIGSDDNALILLDDDGIHPLPAATKTVQAVRVMAHIAKLYARSHHSS